VLSLQAAAVNTTASVISPAIARFDVADTVFLSFIGLS
jgi:hypothetical protein